MKLVQQAQPPIPPLNLSLGMTHFDFIKHLGYELTWDSLRQLHTRQCDSVRTAAGDRCIRGEYILAQRLSEQHKEGVVRMEAPVRIVGDGRIYGYVPDVHFQNGITIVGEVFDNPPKNPNNFVAKCNRYKSSRAHKVMIVSPLDRTQHMYSWNLKGSAFQHYYFDDGLEEFKELLRGKVEAKDLMHHIQMPNRDN